MQNRPKSGPDDGPKQCLNTSRTTILYTWCRHARCNRFLPSPISITPQAQLRLPVLEAVVSKHMALTRLSTRHSWTIVITAFLNASPVYHSQAVVRREAAPLVNHNYKPTNTSRRSTLTRTVISSNILPSQSRSTEGSNDPFSDWAIGLRNFSLAFLIGP